MSNKRTSGAIQARAAKIGISYEGSLWTEDEIKILKEKYVLLGGKGCAKLIPNHSTDMIIYKANKLGLGNINRKKKGKSWTEEEDNIIKEFYPLEGPNMQKRLPTRSKKNITYRATCVLKVQHIDQTKIWTPEMDKILYDNYEKLGPKKCSEFSLLKNKKVSNILNRAKKLGLKTSSWSENEINIIKTYYASEGQDIQYRLPEHTLVSIQQKAASLGIKVTRKKPISDKITKKVICIETQEIFNSGSEAERKYNIGTVNYSCVSFDSTGGGYHWAFLDDSEKQERLKEFIGKQPKKPFCKKVMCVENKEVYVSTVDASKNTNIKASQIQSAAQGRQKTAGGYHWRYLNEENS